MTSDWIACLRSTTWKSMWMRLPRTGWRCCSLTTTGSALPPSKVRSKSGGARAEQGARLALGHAEGARLVAARIDDAGHESVAAQAAGGA